MVELKSKRAISGKLILDTLNKYCYIVPSVKEAILKDLGFEYDKQLDTRPRIDFGPQSDFNSAFLDALDKIEDSD